MDLGSRNKIKLEGGMASMTDLIFLLLIFFVITSLMVNNNTPIDLPNATDQTPQSTIPVDVAVMVTEDDKYVLVPEGDLDNPMDFETIKPLTISAVQNSKQTKLKIAGHYKASYDAVFRVLMLAQENGWDPVLAYDK